MINSTSLLGLDGELGSVVSRDVTRMHSGGWEILKHTFTRTTASSGMFGASCISSSMDCRGPQSIRSEAGNMLASRGKSLTG